VLRPSPFGRPVSSDPSSTQARDPSVQLPAGALPPKRPPKLTRREWWYVNKWVVIVLSGIAVLFVVNWVAGNVPLVSVSHTFDGTVVTGDHSFTIAEGRSSTSFVGITTSPLLCGPVGPRLTFDPNDTSFFLMNSWSIGTGSTFSASYSDPSDTPMFAWISLGSATCWDTNTSGSFVFSAAGQTLPGQIIFETPVPAILYVNASYSYLAPLDALF